MDSRQSMNRKFTLYTPRTIVVQPTLNERFKHLEQHKFKQQDRLEHSPSVFARLGPQHPPNHKKVHTLKRKTSERDKSKTSKKELDHDIEEYMAKDVRTLDRALDDYMKEGERSKKKKLDQELSQYVAERKTDGSN